MLMHKFKTLQGNDLSRLYMLEYRCPDLEILVYSFSEFLHAPKRKQICRTQEAWAWLLRLEDQSHKEE
jgi:hypothetical protein